MIIDTHAHLYWENFKDDLDEVIKRALDAGITGVINVGVDIKTSQKVLEQLESLQKLTAYSSIGTHPHEAVVYANNLDESIQKDIDKLEEIYNQNPEKVIAVGECGLDFLLNRNDIHPEISLSIEEPKSLQRKLFKAQIDLAKKLNLPLLIHCRDDRSQNPTNSECWNEVLDLVKDHFGVLHCYSGMMETTQKALNGNFLFSFAGNLTYPKNEYLKEAVKVIPLDRILVETDCPFLPPQSKRGTRNEPCYITETLKTIADIKNMPLKEVELAIYQNTSQLFKLRL